jgi:hypothetical protein
MFSLASSKLSNHITFPNPNLANHFFAVSALIFFTANAIQFTASRIDTDLSNAGELSASKQKGKAIPVTGRESP